MQLGVSWTGPRALLVALLGFACGGTYGDEDSPTVDPADLNTAPDAEAGADQNVLVGSRVTLDGSGSLDADGDALTYAWTFTVNPGAAELVDATSVRPTFVPPVAGRYVVQLVVSDGLADSLPDTVATVAHGKLPEVDPTLVD